MRALVTGGAGFIGSHLAEALLNSGHEVAVLDDLSTGTIENLAHLVGRPGFSYTIGSACNEKLVGELMERCDMTFHLAAAVGVRLAVASPVHTIQTNVHGTETVLRNAARHHRLVVVASTSEVYGKGTVFPCREDADLVLGPPTTTRWGYAASKLIDEFLALAYWKEHRQPVIVARLFNTVGPRQSERYGMVIPNFVRRALEGQPLIVHGFGSQTRSFTAVGDVVAALIALVNEPRAVGEVFNIGSSAEVSILELAEKVRAMAYSDSPIHFKRYREVFGDNFEDMARRVPDISKIQRLVGYQPTVQLDEIIERVIDFWELQTNVAPRALRSPSATATEKMREILASRA